MFCFREPYFSLKELDYFQRKVLEYVCPMNEHLIIFMMKISVLGRYLWTIVLHISSNMTFKFSVVILSFRSFYISNFSVFDMILLSVQWLIVLIASFRSLSYLIILLSQNFLTWRRCIKLYCHGFGNSKNPHFDCFFFTVPGKSFIKTLINFLYFLLDVFTSLYETSNLLSYDIFTG